MEQLVMLALFHTFLDLLYHGNVRHYVMPDLRQISLGSSTILHQEWQGATVAMP
jgi:hypothetical protein